MVSDSLIVLNRAGIHTRPAAVIVKTATAFKSEVFFEKDTMKINAKSIMGVITLGATWKSVLTCICEGPDEEAALAAMKALFEARFEEK